MTEPRVLLIIPARYASSRFPGKPLADIGGKTMIERVWRQCQLLRKQAPERIDVLVATDDARIEAHLQARGIPFCHTSPAHRTGTERCAEALQLWQEQEQKHCDIVINVQGDEPFVHVEQIWSLIDCLGGGQEAIATLAKRMAEPALAASPDTVKVFFDAQGLALAFSRSVPPEYKQQPLYKHLGLYAFRASLLPELVALPPSPLELAQSLEQLRWFEAGYAIRIVETELESISVDRPEHIEACLVYMQKHGLT